MWKDGRGPKNIYLDILLNHMLECLSLSQLDFFFKSLFLLSAFSRPWPLSLPFRNWHCSGPRFHRIHNPQADVKFTRTTTTSENADPAKKHLVDGAWYFWWVGENLFFSISPSQLSSARLRNTLALSAFVIVHYSSGI